MKQIPALLSSEELKRKMAKKEVNEAIQTLLRQGQVAGIAGRTMFEFKALAGYMTKEINREIKCENRVGGSSQEREIQAN